MLRHLKPETPPRPGTGRGRRATLSMHFGLTTRFRGRGQEMTRCEQGARGEWPVLAKPGYWRQVKSKPGS